MLVKRLELILLALLVTSPFVAAASDCSEYFQLLNEGNEEMRDSDHLKRNMYVTADNNPLQLTASSTKR